MSASKPAWHGVGKAELWALRAGLFALGTARTKPRPFYRRWWFRAPAVLAVLLIFGAANNFGDPSTTPSSAGQRSGPALGDTAVAQAAPTSAPTLPTDQGWVLDSYRLQDRALGDFGGTVRITNTNKAAQSAVFTIFVMAKGQVVASLQGSADNAGAGKTVTVQLSSQDKYRSGSHTVDFQTAVTHYGRPTALVRSRPTDPAKDSDQFLGL
ncbi:MAG: hypothetical protein HHJ11_00855 [Phycicoccus sp.]|nr:hypothetical protein [Phycicoccus sp.]NMM34558.1 hypothetical protein [Phycicoccus sp.]